MTLTQIASIYTGASNQTEALERMTNVHSKIGDIIHIMHAKNDTILDTITAKYVKSDEHFISKVDSTDLYDFTVFSEQSYDEHLIKGNRIIIPAENSGEYAEYVIDRVDDTRNHQKEIEVFCYASYLDISKAKVINPFTFKGTAEQHLARALANTEHELGVIESASDITISFSNHTNPYEYIKRIAMEFKLEVNFRVLHNGTRVTNRVVDLVECIGAFKGREITFGQDLQEIKRSESGEIYTALIGISPEDEDGNRKEVFVEDLNALNIWGRPDATGKLQHLVGVYEPQSERDDMTLTQLRQYTQTELNKRIKAITNYEVKFLDLENIIGHSEKEIRFGDTIRIKDTKFKPYLYVEARIFGMRRSVVRPMQKEYILGDFVEYSEEELRLIYNAIRNGITQNTYNKATIDKKDKQVEIKADEYTDTEISKLKSAGEFEQVIVRQKDDVKRNSTVIQGSTITMKNHETGGQVPDSISSLHPYALGVGGVGAGNMGFGNSSALWHDKRGNGNLTLHDSADNKSGSLSYQNGMLMLNNEVVSEWVFEIPTSIQGVYFSFKKKGKHVDITLTEDPYGFLNSTDISTLASARIDFTNDIPSGLILPKEGQTEIYTVFAARVTDKGTNESYYENVRISITLYEYFGDGFKLNIDRFAGMSDRDGGYLTNHKIIPRISAVQFKGVWLDD